MTRVRGTNERLRCTPPARSPYDTLEEVIGLRGTPGHGSLREWGVAYRELPLAPGGGIDWDALATAIRPGTLPEQVKAGTMGTTRKSR